MVVGFRSTIRLPSLGFKCVRGAVRRLDVGLGGLVTFMTASLGTLCLPWQGWGVSRMPGGALFCGLGGLVMFMTAVWAPCTLAGRVGASRGCQGGAGLRPQTPVPPQSPTTEALQANFQNNQPSKQPITQPADKHKMRAFEI